MAFVCARDRPGNSYDDRPSTNHSSPSSSSSCDECCYGWCVVIDVEFPVWWVRDLVRCFVVQRSTLHGLRLASVRRWGPAAVFLFQPCSITPGTYNYNNSAYYCIWTCLMYHAACKVEFQQFKLSYSDRFLWEQKVAKKVKVFWQLLVRNFGQ